MKYRIGYSKMYEKELQKIQNEQLLLDLNAALLLITANPLEGKLLLGNWQGSNTRTYPFGLKPEMRLFYQIYPCKTCAQFIANRLSCSPDSDDCETSIIFGGIKTREQCNNYYKLKKKQIPVFEEKEDSPTSDIDNPE